MYLFARGRISLVESFAALKCLCGFHVKQLQKGTSETMGFAACFSGLVSFFLVAEMPSECQLLPCGCPVFLVLPCAFVGNLCFLVFFARTNQGLSLPKPA